jgi:hypothetical protein
VVVNVSSIMGHVGMARRAALRHRQAWP